MSAERFGLGAALWRTRRYLLPELKHFLASAALSGIAMLLELASTLVFFDLLTNKVFLGDPLTSAQAGLLGLDPARFVDVEALDEEARFTLRTVFLMVAGALVASGFLLGTGLGYYLTWILQRVNQHLRLAMMDRAAHLSLRYHDEAPVGDAIYRVYQDSAMVTTVVQNALIQPVTALVNLGIALVAALRRGWRRNQHRRGGHPEHPGSFAAGRHRHRPARKCPVFRPASPTTSGLHLPTPTTRR